jgi:hypothetical protein
MHSRADENMRQALRMWDLLTPEERAGTWAMAQRHGIETPMDVALEMCRRGRGWASRVVNVHDGYVHATVLRSTRAVILRMVPDFFDNGMRWGDYCGDIEIEGIRFETLSPNKGKHRFKVQCPICDKLFGPARLIQHATVHGGQ